MHMAVVLIICIALVVFGGMSMAQGFMTSADTSGVSIEGISLRDGEIMRTDIATVSATLLFWTDHVRVKLGNEGQTKLSSFDNWDFFIQYYDISSNYYTEWLPYTEGVLGNNQWKKIGIYLDAGDKKVEAFEPLILNAGEEMLMDARLSPDLQEGSNAGITVSAPNGVTDTISFSVGNTVLVPHSETKTLAGTGYYLLKEGTTADGTAMTESTDAFGAEETGRKIMHNDLDISRPARHVFLLTNIDEIPSSNWNIYYLARTWGDPDFPNGPQDAEVSADIIIRQADGTVRTTIATEVARAQISTPETWETISGTYSFPGHTVVDQTDYLEIVYYGRALGSGPAVPMYIQVRVDDNSLAHADQTRVEAELVRP